MASFKPTDPRLPFLFDGVHRRERGIHTAHAEKHTSYDKGEGTVWWWSQCVCELAVRRQTVGQLEALVQLGPDVVKLGRDQGTQVMLQLLELAIGRIRVP